MKKFTLRSLLLGLLSMMLLAGGLQPASAQYGQGDRRPPHRYRHRRHPRRQRPRRYRREPPPRPYQR